LAHVDLLSSRLELLRSRSGGGGGGASALASSLTRTIVALVESAFRRALAASEAGERGAVHPVRVIENAIEHVVGTTDISYRDVWLCVSEATVTAFTKTEDIANYLFDQLLLPPEALLPLARKAVRSYAVDAFEALPASTRAEMGSAAAVGAVVGLLRGIAACAPDDGPVRVPARAQLVGDAALMGAICGGIVRENVTLLVAAATG
jgi:hypothetical protein